MIDMLLRNTSRGDIGIDAGRIVAATADARETRDLRGALVTPPLVQPHIHLDAVLTVGQPRPNVSGSLFEGIAIWAQRVRDLSVEDENRLGQELHELILSRQLALENADLTKRVRLASRPLITKGFRRELPDDAFTILDSEDPFAFSHPGGYFYLSSALFALLSSEEELRFVIAHEMAHVELKHALKQLEAQQSKLQGLGTAEQLYRLIAQGYETAQEYEADRWAVTLLLKLDHTRRECLAFLRKFKGYSEDHGFGEGRKRPKFGLTSPVQEVENHFRAHPAAWERLDRLEQSFDALKAHSPIAR